MLFFLLVVKRSRIRSREEPASFDRYDPIKSMPKRNMPMPPSKGSIVKMSTIFSFHNTVLCADAMTFVWNVPYQDRDGNGVCAEPE